MCGVDWEYRNASSVDLGKSIGECLSSLLLATVEKETVWQLFLVVENFKRSRILNYWFLKLLSSGCIDFRQAHKDQSLRVLLAFPENRRYVEKQKIKFFMDNSIILLKNFFLKHYFLGMLLLFSLSLRRRVFLLLRRYFYKYTHKNTFLSSHHILFVWGSMSCLLGELPFPSKCALWDDEATLLLIFWLAGVVSRNQRY